LPTNIDAISALAELERLDWKYEAIGEEELKLLCPAHEDTNPSATMNVAKKLWNCKTCKAKGDIVSFLAYATKSTRAVVLAELGTRYELTEVKEVDQRLIERYHANLWASGPLIAALRARGVTDDMARHARLGVFDGRITIPVYDQQGRVVNVRRYLPGAPSNLKMRNTRGMGTEQLYQVAEAVAADKVWICGGEIKGLVVGRLLAQYGIAACSSTAGEGSWDSRWSELLRGKDVWICMDVDKAGEEAAAKIAGYLLGIAKSVRIIELPLDKAKYPKGDVNDLVGQEHATADDLLRLMSLAKEFERQTAIVVKGPIGTRKVRLHGSTRAENVGWLLKVDAVVSAVDTSPFLVPREVHAGCSKDQPQCHMCPVNPLQADDQGRVLLTVASNSEAIVEMVNSPRSVQSIVLQAALGIPQCRAVELIPFNHHTVLDARLSAQLELTSGGEPNIMQSTLLVGIDPEENVPHTLTARLYPHPRSQQAVLVADAATPSEDSLRTFAPSDSELKELEQFQPTEWTLAALETRLDALYSGLETSVTRILGRRDMHQVMWLTWHSPLYVMLGGRRINGWLNTLVLGDSSQGKTEAASCIQAWLGLGERTVCKGATIAGLMGGLQQMGSGGRWFATWGVIPRHDSRLVILEEVKGAHVDVIGKLTDMRSSGIAEIPKIERRKARARTRLIFISNARGNRPLASYSFGVEAVHELIGATEDVRRFDLACAVSNGQVDVAALKLTTKTIEPPSQALCRRLALWAWTREEDKVLVSKEAETALEEAGKDLCARYTEMLPLVDRGTVVQKLARLAAASACQTFSCEGEAVIVRACHVQHVAALLDRCYKDPAMGYADFSRAAVLADRMPDQASVKKRLLQTKFPASLVRQLMYTDSVTLQDAQDWLELAKDDAQRFVSFLVRNHALRRRRDAYHKSPDFIRLLKDMDQAGVTEGPSTDGEEY